MSSKNLSISSSPRRVKDRPLSPPAPKSSIGREGNPISPIKIVNPPEKIAQEPNGQKASPKPPTGPNTRSPRKFIRGTPAIVNEKEIVQEPIQRVYERQILAPSPSQSYYQVVVDDQKVILREWPRLRYSQAVAGIIVKPEQMQVSISNYPSSSIEAKVREVMGVTVVNDIDKFIASNSMVPNQNTQIPPT